MVFCVRYKKEMEGLEEPPFDSEFGQKIYKNVSKVAWDEWINRQKMLLNEYRLQPWLPQAQQFLVEQMEEYLLRLRPGPAVGVRPALEVGLMRIRCGIQAWGSVTARPHYCLLRMPSRIPGHGSSYAGPKGARK